MTEPQHWTEGWLGREWRPGEYDCGEFAAEVLRARFGRDVAASPLLAGRRRRDAFLAALARENAAWRLPEGEEPAEGDVALLARAGSLLPHGWHLGVLVCPAASEPALLHLDRIGSRLTPIGRLEAEGMALRGWYRLPPDAVAGALAPGPERPAAARTPAAGPSVTVLVSMALSPAGDGVPAAVAVPGTSPTVMDALDAVWPGAARLPPGELAARIAVDLDGEAMPAACWREAPLGEGSRIAVRPAAAGNTGDWLRGLLAIATLALALYLPTLGWAWYYTAAAVAGVQIGGQLLINELFPPESYEAIPDAAGSAEPVYSLRAGGNRARPWGPMTLVLGTHRVFPPAIVPPWGRIKGGRERVYATFSWGVGDLDISDMRHGGEPLDTAGITELTWEPREALTSTLANPRTRNTTIYYKSGQDWVKARDNTGGTRYPSAWFSVEPEAQGTLELQVTENAYPIGLNDDVRIGFRKADGSGLDGNWRFSKEVFAQGSVVLRTYGPLTDLGLRFRDGHFLTHGLQWDYDNLDATQQAQVRKICRQNATGDTIAVIVDPGISAPLARIPAIAPGGVLELASDEVLAEFDDAWSVIIDLQGYLYDASGQNVARRTVSLKVQSRAPGGNWANVTGSPFTLANDKLSLFRTNISVRGPWVGTREFRVTRADDRSTSSRIRTDITVRQIYSWSSGDPLTQDRSADTVTAVIATAGPQIGGSLGRISGLVSQKVPAWDTATKSWGATNQKTSNPAAVLRAFARGWESSGGDLLAGAGRPAALIDDANLGAWYDWCAAHDPVLGCNLVIDRPQRAEDVERIIAACGRAAISWASGKFGVVWEAQSAAQGLISPRSVVAGSMAVSWPRAGRGISEIAVRHLNADWEWAAARAVVPGAASGGAEATITRPGVTNDAQGAMEARLLAARQAYAPRVITWEAGPAGAALTAGSVWLMSHDLAGGGTTGTCAAIPALGIVDLAGDPDFQNGDTLLLQLDANTLFSSVVDRESPTRALLRTPLPALPAADPGDIVWRLYSSAHPPLRVRITSNRPLSRDRFRITAIDDDPRYHAAAAPPSG